MYKLKNWNGIWVCQPKEENFWYYMLYRVKIQRILSKIWIYHKIIYLIFFELLFCCLIFCLIINPCIKCANLLINFCSTIKTKGKNMDTQIPPQIRSNIGAPLSGVQIPPQMPPMMMGVRPPVAMISPFSVLPEQEEKKR